MSKLDQDARLNRRLLHDKPGRRFLTNEDAHWGELILPAPGEGEGRGDRGLRVLLFASMGLGLHAVKSLVAYARHFPGRVNMVGLVTDDAINAAAHISLKKRGWHFLTADQRLEVEAATVEAALASGAPVYTGEIKVDWFRRHAAGLRPDVILVCGFGQVIDAPILQLPPLGIYNFHPSDLVGQHGAGPAPFGDLARRKTTKTRWTVHQVSDVLDGGAVVGQSPEIDVGNAAGEVHKDPVTIESKMSEPLPFLLRFLMDALIERRQESATGPLKSLDFPSLIPEAPKARFLVPILDSASLGLEAEPDPAAFA